MLEILGFLGQYVCFFILHVCGGGAFPKPLSEKAEELLHTDHFGWEIPLSPNPGRNR